MGYIINFIKFRCSFCKKIILPLKQLTIFSYFSYILLLLYFLIIEICTCWRFEVESLRRDNTPSPV